MQLPTDTQYNEYVTPAQGALEFATSEAAIRNLIQRARVVTVWRPTPRFPALGTEHNPGRANRSSTR